MTLFKETPFDILVRNFFNSELGNFAPVQETKIGYPVDVYEGLHFELACVGLTKSDIKIDSEGDTIKIAYTKPQEEEQELTMYHYRGITRRSFNLGYKVAPRFELTQASATMDNGLLKILIPFAESAKPKSLEIL